VVSFTSLGRRYYIVCKLISYTCTVVRVEFRAGAVQGWKNLSLFEKSFRFLSFFRFLGSRGQRRPDTKLRARKYILYRLHYSSCPVVLCKS